MGEYEVYLNLDELIELEEMREDLEFEECEYIDDLETRELFW